jgi:hypothetical protein
MNIVAYAPCDLLRLTATRNPNYKDIKGQTPVAHSCNLSYSGGRDQEDLGLKPAQGK